MSNPHPFEPGRNLERFEAFVRTQTAVPDTPIEEDAASAPELESYMTPADLTAWRSEAFRYVATAVTEKVLGVVATILMLIGLWTVAAWTWAAWFPG